jgi:MoaA/NifB/PqqE/SkfB family radical SAM enzyme
LSYAISPTSLTILCTYQCTAACAQCCFESSPHLSGRLDGATIRDRITEAKTAFPRLQLVVFSGGEPFLLKDDLVEAVAHCSTLGLRSRIVTNGSWAKRAARAEQTCERLREAGLTELNVSTGRDHQQWVDHGTVVNAARAAVAAGLRVLVTIETDTENSSCLESFRSDPRVIELSEHALFAFQANYWMPFHGDAPDRLQSADLSVLRKGCGQVFNNVVITPRDDVAACCGLTFEHIPEMHLGPCSDGGLAERYRSQADDFLKYWLKVDGPYSIIERLMGDEAPALLADVVHQCQACAVLHSSDAVGRALASRYEEFVPEVMTRHVVATALDVASMGGAR